MKKILPTLIFVCLQILFSLNTNAQCPCAVGNFGTIDVNGWAVGQSANITTCIYGGERSQIHNSVNGAVYRVSTCGATFNTQLTIYTNPGCGYLAYNDDNGTACTGTAASIDFTSPGGSLFAVVNRFNCTTENTCVTLSIQLISLPVPGTVAINSICDGPRVTVSGATSIQWQGSTDNVTYTDIAGAITATYNIPAASPNSYFRNRSGASFSNVVQVVPLSSPSDIVVTMNTIMGGNYNISGDFTLNAGQTINMIDACAVQLTAVNVTISGVINGDGRGNAGGIGGAGGVWAFNEHDTPCSGGHGGVGGGAGVGIGGGTAGNTGNNGGCIQQICGNLFCIGNQDGYNGGGAGGSGGSGGSYGGMGGFGAFSASGAGFSTPVVISGGSWVGGNSAPAIYGTASGTDIAMGSGGGGGGGGGGAMANGTQGGAGGRGGGMVKITATNNITVTGTIRCNGTNGSAGGNGGGRSFDNTWNCIGITGYNNCAICPQRSFDAPAGAGGGAGGGSGGGIKLVGNGVVTITGTLQTIGGTGGSDGLPNPSHGTCFDFARGGAGGGGGRIKIFSNPCLNHNINPTVAFSGGTGGIGHTTNGANGSIGTYTINNHPSYATINGGNIAVNQSFCEGNIPNPFTNTLSPTGGLGTFNYAWYSCIGGTCPTPIAGNPIPGVGWTNRATNALTFAETNTLFQTTTYIRGVASGNCYSWSNIITVSVNPNPIVSISPTSAVICEGSSTTITASGANTFSWSHGLGTGSSKIVSPVTTTTYIVTGTNASGCTGSTSVTVTVNPNPTVSISPAAPQICLGFSTTLVAGGASTFNWSGGFGTNASQTVSPISTTIYTVTGTDTSGCSGTAQITVTVNPNPLVSVSPSAPAICIGSSTTLTASGATTYNWSHGLGTNDLQNVSPTSTTTYTVTGTTSGCSGTTSVTVTVNPNPILNLGSNFNLCTGDSAILNAGAGFSYNWSTTQTSQTISVSTGGTYSVTVTDGNNCQASSQITVTSVNQQDATILTTGPFCSNVSPVQFIAQYSGGLWSGSGISAGGLFDPAVAGSGTHAITYGIAGLCGDTTTANITVNVAPIVDLGAPQTVCIGDTVTLDAGPGISYNWLPSGSSQTMSVTTSGTYSVTVTDSNGCQGSDDVIITFLVQQDASILTDGPFCSNSGVQQFISQDGGGIWSGNGINATGEFNPTFAGSGNHTITYTIAGYCGDTDSKVITVNETPAVTLTHTDESCIGANDGTIILSVNGGVQPYIILWDDGSLQMNLENLLPGEYSVIVTDQKGCADADSVRILFSFEECFPPHVYIPNIFSPNGDNLNDVLYVRGEGIVSIEFIVFNRWGETVFTTQNINEGWDGTFKGKPIEPAVYVYFLKVTMRNNEFIEKSGNITLVR